MKNFYEQVSFIVLAFFMLVLTGCKSKEVVLNEEIPVNELSDEIYLYGEQHGVEKIMDKELKLWGEYYENADMRHLFVEYSYFTAELLNLWMQSDSDEILEELYKDWYGTASYNPYVMDFYKKIKSQYPETIFHGTDVGHQYETTGQRFLNYLKEHNMENSEQYALTEEAIEQGIYYYKHSDDAYRENKMVENFIREFDKLENTNIMGIYGSAHIDFNAKDYVTNTVSCMAKQLKERYNDSIYSEDLSWLAKEIEAFRVDTIIVNDKEYQASYFGKEDLTGFKDYVFREFWRLEQAYEDFKGCKKIKNVLPYNNYPMLIEKGQVFVVDFERTDGSVERVYYRSDGYIWNGLESTEEFVID